MTMNIIIIFSILLSIYKINSSPTIEQCDSVMKSQDKYIPKECKCFQDYPVCLLSNVISGKCTKETFPKDNPFTKPCKDIYSQCSLKKNDCEIGLCECLNSMIDCILQKKCKPLTNTKLIDSETSDKKIRSFNDATNFGEFMDGYF